MTPICRVARATGGQLRIFRNRGRNRRIESAEFERELAMAAHAPCNHHFDGQRLAVACLICVKSRAFARSTLEPGARYKIR